MSSIISYSLTEGDNGAQLTIVSVDGSTNTINDKHANFKKVLDVIHEKPEGWQTRVYDLVYVTGSAAKKFRSLTDRVTVDDRNLYFDGDPVDNSLARYIMKLLGESDSGVTSHDVTWEALVKFLEKLYANPSVKSRESLYDFLRDYGLTIRSDGNFIAYKGLNANLTSIHAGYGIVDGVEMNGNLPNAPGSVVRFPRSKVEADTAIGCSTGLHAGTLEYASGFGQRIMAVSVNPMHVVSVPDDHAYAKIRTCEYEVLVEIDPKTEIRATKGAESAVFWHEPRTSTHASSDSKDVVVGSFSVGASYNFEYISANGNSKTITNATVEELRRDNVLMKFDDGRYRTYLFEYISEISKVDESAPASNHAPIAQPAETSIETPAQSTSVDNAVKTVLGQARKGDLIHFKYNGMPRQGVIVSYFGKDSVTIHTTEGYRTYLLDRIAQDSIENRTQMDRATQSAAPAHPAPVKPEISKDFLNDVKLGSIISFDYKNDKGELGYRIGTVQLVDVAHDRLNLLVDTGGFASAPSYRTFAISQIDLATFKILQDPPASPQVKPESKTEGPTGSKGDTFDFDPKKILEAILGGGGIVSTKPEPTMDLDTLLKAAKHMNDVKKIVDTLKDAFDPEK